MLWKRKMEQGNGVRTAVFNRMVRVSFIEKVAFEQRSEGWKRMSLAVFWEKSSPIRGTAKRGRGVGNEI